MDDETREEIGALVRAQRQRDEAARRAAQEPQYSITAFRREFRRTAEEVIRPTLEAFARHLEESDVGAIVDSKVSIEAGTGENVVDAIWLGLATRGTQLAPAGRDQPAQITFVGREREGLVTVCARAPGTWNWVAASDENTLPDVTSELVHAKVMDFLRRLFQQH